MHLILPFFGCAMLLASCSVQYQYATIKSPDVSLNEKYEFVADNDTLRIRYNFNGPGAPMTMVIENKLDLPVYIDWKQSALIMNGRAITYAPTNIPITGDLSMTRTNLGNRTDPYATGSINAVAAVQPGMDFMPPHTFIEKRPMSLGVGMADLPDSTSRVVTMPSGMRMKFKEASFADSTSPIRFRSYLTLSVGEITAKQLRIEHSFYVSELITTKLNPENFGYRSENRPDKYFVGQSGKGSVGGVVAGLVLGSVLIAAMAHASQNSADPD